MNRPGSGATEAPVSSSEHDGISRDGVGGRGGAWLSAGLVLVSAVVLATVLFLAAKHLDDRYLLDHVSGTRMALARYYNGGTLYPELFDGGHYGGTRWMPLPIVAHGLLASVTGDYLVSGRVFGYASMAGVLVTMAWLMRGMGAPGPLALGLMAVVLATRTGFSAAFDLRFDAFPLLLQLVAVGIVARSLRPGAVVGAAGLAALALVSKLSALWAPLGIVVWLLLRDRRRLVWFVAAYVVFAAAFLLLFIALSEGRMVENVFGLASSGVAGLRSFLVAPYRLLHLLVSHAPAAWALLPLVGFAAWTALRQRQDSIYVIGLLWALAILLFVLSDIGTGWNQLLDVIVLAALVLGEAAERMQVGMTAPTERSGVRAATVLALAVVWVVASGLAVTLVPAAQQAAANPGAYARAPLAGLATPRSSILSEDPYVPLSLGQTPVVLDPFMLLRLGRGQPEAVTTLAERIERREFDLVVLVVPLEPLDQEWWQEYHFGPEIIQAVDRSYHFSSRVQGYYVYVPAEGDG
jgi:hypothetical protein